MSYETMIYSIQMVTFILCIINYVMVLYQQKWDFASYTSIGWFMAVLGWLNVVV